MANYSIRSLTLLTIGLIIGSSVTFFSFHPNEYVVERQIQVQTTSQNPLKIKASRSYISPTPSKSDGLRILCWIPVTYKDKKVAKAAKFTWTTRCNILLFIGGLEDDEVESLDIGVSDDDDDFWFKIKESFLHIYDRYRDEVDWILQASPDSYVVMDNLRAFLSTQNSSKPVFFGSKHKFLMNQANINSHAAYVLSIGALRLFKASATNCWESDEGIDQTLGNCLLFIGVKEGNSKDSKGRSRFFPYSPQNMLVPSYGELSLGNWQNLLFAEGADIVCCSDTTISFHDVDPATMWLMEFFLYHMRIDGKCIEATPPPLHPLPEEIV